MEVGIKHLIKCRCILPQFKSQPSPPVHQFIVFSVFDDETDKLKMKFTQCNNCGIIHKVIDVCVSEIMPGRENLGSIMTLDEIKSCLSEQLVTILETSQVDYATYEQAKWIVDNQRWGDFVVLMSDTVDGLKQGKYIRIISNSLFKIDTFTRDDTLDTKGKNV